MNIQRRARQIFLRLSWPGVAGVALIALALIVWFSWVDAQQHSLQELQRESVSLKKRIDQIAKQGIPEQDSQGELARFYGYFSGTPLTAWLDKLYAAADSEKVQLEQGEYRLAQDKGGQMLRYQITLPVTGSYTQIRQFIEHALADVPIAALDDVNFKRENIAAAQVQARIKFTLFLHADKGGRR